MSQILNETKPCKYNKDLFCNQNCCNECDDLLRKWHREYDIIPNLKQDVVLGGNSHQTPDGEKREIKRGEENE